MEFKDRIKQLRQKATLTQLELGKILNLSESTISLYESGKRLPEYDTLIKIANYFNVSIDYLLGRADDEQLLTKDDFIKRLGNDYREILDNIDFKYFELIKDINKSDLDIDTLRHLVQVAIDMKKKIEQNNQNNESDNSP